MKPLGKETYTVPEAAEILGVHHLTVRKAIARGELRAVRIGRRVLVPRKALEALLDGDRRAAVG